MNDAPPPADTLRVSWDELHRHAKALAGRLLSAGPFTGIIAVTRGGLVPAAIIARELGIRLVDTICIASYDERNQGKIEILKAVAGDGEGMLVIDDLVDTGRTGGAIRHMLPKAYFAAIYAKPAGRSQLDAFVAEIDQDSWVLFPWDIEPQFKAPLHTVKS